MGDNKVYTIEDIARELGVSTSTVSRSVSGKGRISEATRRKVLDFIEQHDYRPSAQAKGLSQNRTYNLGLILPTDFSDASPSFFRECMNGICETAADNNYDVVISMTDGTDLSQVERQIANRKIDGAIISRSTADAAAERVLKGKKIPFVVIGPTADPDVHYVDNNNQAASRELTELLMMKGMTRLALIGGSSRHQVTESRMEGFREAHRNRMAPVDESLIFMEVDNPVKADRAVETIWQAGADGIICMDDSICMYVLGCLRGRGIKVPRQMRLASFYDSVQLEYNVTPVTSLRFDAKELGRESCRVLLEMLAGRTVESRCLSNYELVLRESTK